jgi:uncharacterized protein YndB with AHSA1/START domain
MGEEAGQPVSVSRRIAAPAADIFGILADPGQHPAFDGSGMLREGASNPIVSGLGDVFVMKMNNPHMGDYEMDNHVVEFEADRRIGWEPVAHGETRGVETPHRNGSKWVYSLSPEGPDATVVTETYDCSGSPETVREAVAHGTVWVDAMTKSLERLDQLASTGHTTTPA